MAEIGHTATVLKITLEIINLVEDPKSTAADLDQMISHDLTLGSRILNVVDSGLLRLKFST